MSDELINKVMAEVMKKMGDASPASPAPAARPAATEFVGTNALGDTPPTVCPPASRSPASTCSPTIPRMPQPASAISARIRSYSMTYSGAARPKR